MRQQRRVGRNDHYDRATTFMFKSVAVILCSTTGGRTRRNAGRPWSAERRRNRRANAEVSDLGTNRNTENAQIPAVVTLNQHSDRVPALLRGQYSRGSADSAFESVATHSGAAAHCAFFNWTRLGAIECCKRMSRLYMFAVRIV